MTQQIMLNKHYSQKTSCHLGLEVGVQTPLPFIMPEISAMDRVRLFLVFADKTFQSENIIGVK